MKKISSLLILLSIFLIPTSYVEAAEVGGTFNEIAIPTQTANRSAVLYVPVASCNARSSTDFCNYTITVANRTYSSRITINTPKNKDNNYYQLIFDLSGATTKGAKYSVNATVGSTTITTHLYTAEESTINGTCSTESTLVTKQGRILTRKVGNNAVEEYYELISILNPPGNYDVVAGTGVEFPISIYYTYQGTNSNGTSLINYGDFIDNNPLSMYVNYTLPEKLNVEYPSNNESYKHRLPYDNTLKQNLSNEIFLQTGSGTEYTTAYYTDQEAANLGLVAAGYKKLQNSCRTEYQWRRQGYKWETKTDNSLTDPDTCKALNDDPNIKGAYIDSSTTCYQSANLSPRFVCYIYCINCQYYPCFGGKRFGPYTVYVGTYVSSCDISKNDACKAALNYYKGLSENKNKSCSVDSSTYYTLSGYSTTTSKKISCSKDNGCLGRHVDRKTIKFCSYEEKVFYPEYYVGAGNWSKVQANGIWTIERPDNTYEGENITQVGTRQTCRYYRVPSGDFAYQTTELRKYELPQTYIEKGTSYIYKTATSNTISGGRRLYTNLKASDGLLNVRVLGTNIGMNKYRYDTSCNFNLLANGLFDKNGLILYRPIDPKDPFPRYAPLSNWKGKEYLITKLGYGVYTVTPEYHVMLSSDSIQSIRGYNSRNKYLDYRINNKGESEFIHKSFSNLFRINK